MDETTARKMVERAKLALQQPATSSIHLKWLAVRRA